MYQSCSFCFRLTLKALPLEKFSASRLLGQRCNDFKFCANKITKLHTISRYRVLNAVDIICHVSVLALKLCRLTAFPTLKLDNGNRLKGLPPCQMKMLRIQAFFLFLLFHRLRQSSWFHHPSRHSNQSDCKCVPSLDNAM